MDQPHGGARGERIRWLKLFQFIFLEPVMSVPSFITVRPQAVEIFQLEPKWQTDKQINFFEVQPKNAKTI